MSDEVEDYDEAFEWIALNEIREGLTSWKGKKAFDYFCGQMELLSRENHFLTSQELRNLLNSALRFALNC